ncbi:MAG: hypothetical protein ABWZ82_05720, partial [Candidatus Limnocylindrales bacterium]
MRARRDSGHPRWIQGALAVMLAALALLLGALPAAAQPTSAAPVASGEPALVRLTARPLLGGHVRPGSWVG